MQTVALNKRPRSGRIERAGADMLEGLRKRLDHVRASVTDYRHIMRRVRDQAASDSGAGASNSSAGPKNSYRMRSPGTPAWSSPLARLRRNGLGPQR